MDERRRRGLIILLLGLAVAKEPAPIRGEQAAPPQTDSSGVSSELARAQELTAQIRTLYEQNHFPEAVPLAEEVLTIHIRAVGENHPGTAGALSNLASMYFEMGQYGRAEPLMTRSLDIFLVLYGEHHEATATAIDNLGGLYHAAGDYQKAEAMFQRCLEIRRKLLGEEHPDTVSTLTNLGGLYQAMGDYGRAEPLMQRSLDINLRMLGEDHVDTATSLNNLAGIYRDIGEFGRAEDLLHRSLAIRRKLLGENHLETANGLNNLAGLYQEVGDYEEAIPLLQRSLEIYLALFGDLHPATARSLGNLALLYTLMGEYAEAEPLLKRSVDIRVKVLGEQHRATANGFNNLASFYREMGRYGEAEPLFLRSIAIALQALGADHPETAQFRVNLGMLYLQTGQFERAEPLFLEGLRVQLKLLGERHPSTASSLNNLAGLYLEMGRYAEAEALFNRSLAVRREILGDNHPDVARNLNNLAGLALATGDLAKAESLLKQSLSIDMEVLGEAHPVTATLLSNLATVYLRMHAPGAALQHADRALAGSLKHLVAAYAGLSGVERFRYQQRFRHLVDVFLTAAVEATVPAADVWSRLLKVKGQVFLLENAIARLDRGPDPAHHALIQQYRGLSSRLSSMERAGRGGAASEEVRQRLAVVDRQLSALVADRLGGVESLDALVSSLPRGAALVDFHYYHRAPTEASAPWVPTFVAFVVRPEQPIVRIDLGEAEPIEALVSRWRLAVGASDVLERTEVGQSLRQRVWSPLEPYLDKVTTILVSPDGPLALLPFGALPGSEPDHYLLEAYAIAITPVPQMLGAEAQRVPQTDPSLLLVGDIDYGTSSSRGPVGPTFGEEVGDLAPAAFRPLNETHPEIDAIGRIFRRASPGSTVARLSGAEATEGAVKAALPGHRISHLSTHGFLLDDTAKEGTAEGAPAVDGAMVSRLDQLPDGRLIDPRSRVGLALAGANGWAGVQDDGMLTALEVNVLDLSRVDLVVTSACETALGADYQGEGMLGLQRAFLIAGAATSVSTLWKVDEREARVLMERFYDNLLTRNMDRLDALREAQLWMLNDGMRSIDEDWRGLGGWWRRMCGESPPPTSPITWGAFTLAGEWR